MQIYEVGGDFYTNYDLAAIKAKGTEYSVKSRELNQTEELEIFAYENGDLILMEEEGEKFKIEYEISFEYEPAEEFQSEYMNYTIEEVYIGDHLLSTLNLSNQIKKDIYYYVERIAEEQAEEKLKNI